MKQLGKIKKMVILYLLVIFTFLCPNVAHADFGPKDKLVVHVKNPPNELYYLDLLTQHTHSYNNFHKFGEREALNKDMLQLLYKYEDEGWKPSLVEGTGVPMWGNLVGEKHDDEMIHTFGYVGVPKTYRIIIVTESGKVSISDVHTRHALKSSITYDYSKGETTVPQIWISYIIQFFTTYIPTIIIEGIILLLFGFKLKDNLKPFVIINTVTQVVLTLTVGIALIKSGSLNAYIVQFPVEIVILITETMLFRKHLIGKSKGQRGAYGVIANVISWGVGFFLIGYQYEVLLNFM